MQKKLLDLFIMSAKFMVYGMLVQLFILNMLLAKNGFSQENQSVREVTININLENGTILEVFKAIESKTSFKFFYDRKVINRDLRFDLIRNNVPVDQLLLELSKEAHLKFRQINNTINVTRYIGNKQSEKILEVIIQGKTVTGKVTSSEDDESLPGVNVVEKGTTNGTVTNVEGNYTLTVSEDATLVFSSVGYTSEEIVVGNRSVIDLAMNQDVKQLEELVVVGYATKQAGELTGAISTVGAEEIKDMVAVNATDALKGTTSGVNIIDSSTPGGDPIIRIRGLGTINNNDPLWIVDGVPNSRVNPENIESISILKDASAQAIYGARAANGVILVTTKSGKKNQPVQVNVSYKQGVTQNTNSYDLLNTAEYGELLWLEATNENGGTLPSGFSQPQYGSGSQPTIPNYISPAGADEADHSTYDPRSNIIMQANKQGTDWLDEASRTGTYREVSVGLNGGSNNTNYAFQVGYLKEDGILKYTSYSRYNLRANVTTRPTEWLEIGERLAITYNQDDGNQSNNAEGSVFGWIYRSQPIVPVYDIAGNYAGSRAPGTGNSRNPLFRLDKNQWDQTQFMRATGNVYAKVDFVEGLSFKTLFGFNNNNQLGRDLTYIEWAASERESINSYSEDNEKTLQWNWSNTLEYSKAFGNHDITILAGTEAIENNFRENTAGRQGYFLTNPDFFQLDAGTENQTNSGNLSEWALFSVFGRLNYQFQQKYLLEAVVRRDASSRFGIDDNAGVFPAVSVGWRISDENFMSFSESWLNLLKIRAGYGVTGNDRIGNYNSYTTYTSTLGGAAWGRTGEDVGSYYPIAGGNETDGAVGFRRNAIGNTSVEWERTTTTNFGINMRFLNNFDFMVDIWQRNTVDMLFQKQIPAVAGRSRAPDINVGEMKNQGIDIELGYTGSALAGELTYNVGLNVSRYKNEVLNLSDNDNEFLQGGTIRGQNFTRAEQGTAFPAFFGYTIEGIFQSDEEANAHPVVTEDPSYNKEGVFNIADTNGDGQIDADDRSFIGSPHPDFTAGLVFNVGYKGFNLYTNLYASVGNDVANAVNHMIDFNKFQGNRSTKRLYESYGSPYLSDNSQAAMPMARINDARDQLPSTYFLESGTYLRMQNLRLAYDLDRLIPDKTLFRNLTLYLHSTNLFTITGYSGLDPEIGASGMNTGVDKGGWPTARRFLLGLNLGI